MDEVVFCRPVYKGGEVVMGCTTDRCSECRTPIYVTPASRKIVARGGRLVCNDCASLMGADDQTEFTIVADTRDELRRRFGWSDVEIDAHLEFIKMFYRVTGRLP